MMIVSVLERMARRLAAGEQQRSRREMLIGRPDGLPAPRVPRVPKAEAARHRTHRPSASDADKSVMRAAIDGAAPTRDDLLTLVEALRDPTSAGTFNTRADKAIHGRRAELAGALRRVSAITTHSVLRDNVLAFLTDVDTILATLQAVGQSTDPARATRLRTRAHTLERRVQTLEHEISPALAVHRHRSGH
jgi:hypothetical protein